jgi:hypothetical protein
LLWPQAQPDQRPERPGPRPGDRDGQPGRQRALPAHAGSPHRVLRQPATPDGGRRRLGDPRQSRPGQGQRRQRRRVPQETRAIDRSQGQEPLGLSQAAQLPRRHRGGHLLPQARRWPGPLPVARPRALQGVRLVFGRRRQPGASGTTHARMAARSLSMASITRHAPGENPCPRQDKDRAPSAKPTSSLKTTGLVRV